MDQFMDRELWEVVDQFEEEISRKGGALEEWVENEFRRLVSPDKSQPRMAEPRFLKNAASQNSYLALLSKRPANPVSRRRRLEREADKFMEMDM
jgi:hypothetical protein